MQKAHYLYDCDVCFYLALVTRGRLPPFLQRVRSAHVRMVRETMISSTNSKVLREGNT